MMLERGPAVDVRRRAHIGGDSLDIDAFNVQPIVRVTEEIHDPVSWMMP
jgi:hypothetical protein